MGARAQARVERDIEFAVVEGHRLALDLHLPERQSGALVVWVHGGAWRSGSRADMPLGKLVEDGFAVASVSYRLSTVAKFPAQIHDIKAAIRFLRSEGKRLGVDASMVVVAGASAGGHLAALVGVTNGHAELEGSVGGRKDSSNVQGIVSFFGGSDLTSILKQSTPHGLSVRVPALELLLGGQPAEKAELARLASPVFHIDADDPPLLLFHGDQDEQMPINQAHQLVGAYEKVGASAKLHVLYGAGHGGKVFYEPTRIEVVKSFLNGLRR